MDREPVGSSNLVSAGYDEASQTLEVEFSNGSVYQYYNVSEPIYREFLMASSKGSFLNTYIKASFPFSRVG